MSSKFTNKKGIFEKIFKRIEKCSFCQKHRAFGKFVPGEGSLNAKITFIGEAPGREEAKTGRPFVGRSGKYLRSLIKEIGLKEDRVFITSPVKYLPKKGTPDKTEIEHGKIHFNKQMNLINPKIIVLLGRVACSALLEECPPILKVHGKVIEKDNREYFLTIHPAAAIRFDKFKKVIKGDFKKLKKII